MLGRAVHCAPGLVMQTQLLELESCRPRPYGRGYGAERRAPLWGAVL